TLLDLVNDVLTGATYPADEVRAERDRTADEVVMDLSRPEVQAGEAFRARLYGDHPYATPTPRPDALRRVGAASLRTIHPRIFNPRGAHLIVVGDVATARVERLVSERLGPWLAGASRAAAPLAPLPPITPGGIELHDRPGAPQSNVLVGGAAPRRTDPQWPATALANLVVGGMFTSRLVENLRERHGYTYSPHSDVY
ncbi:peptidase M16 domain-containing protein, partial [mine drainage metagenome]